MRAFTRLSMAASAIMFATCAARADAVEDFYKGKQITLLVGSGAGGGYDAYARVFARHASKHMAGNAVFVVKNMPAAGGMAAANTLFNNVDKDGLTIAAHTNGIAMDPLFGNPGAKFDGTKFAWLGTARKPALPSLAISSENHARHSALCARVCATKSVSPSAATAAAVPAMVIEKGRRMRCIAAMIGAAA